MHVCCRHELERWRVRYLTWFNAEGSGKGLKGSKARLSIGGCWVPGHLPRRQPHMPHILCPVVLSISTMVQGWRRMQAASSEDQGTRAAHYCKFRHRLCRRPGLITSEVLGGAGKLEHKLHFCPLEHSEDSSPCHFLSRQGGGRRSALRGLAALMLRLARRGLQSGTHSPMARSCGVVVPCPQGYSNGLLPVFFSPLRETSSVSA